MTMGNRAFTVIELLIMIGVMSAILVIALPMYAMRAKRPDRAQAKAQLYVIKDAEERHKLHYGSYTADITRLANWKSILGRYQFRIRTADSTQFVAQADGDLNNDKIYDDDTWTIDQSGTLKKVR
ncbi:MAG: hypothetical protein A4E64_00076 [Syntrophorhabdus sp. PtaU1.Bin058]|nr:MAG: hypothetical protein A4E64_00076 [Syntrophorhabdus sp. PtaU1.Bin058]